MQVALCPLLFRLVCPRFDSSTSYHFFLVSTLPHHRYRRRARSARHFHHTFIALWGTGGLPSTTVPRTTAVPVPVRTRWLFADTTGRTVDGDPVPVTRPLVVRPYPSDGRSAALVASDQCSVAGDNRAIITRVTRVTISCMAPPAY